MIKDLHVVVNTNVLISGSFGITNSPSSKILDVIRSQKIILTTSPVIIQEIKNVLNRKRIVKITKMTTKERADFIDNLIERSDVTKGKQLSEISGRDIKDDKFLACAIEGKADYIISGDEDLLDIKEFKGIKIITPRKFVEILEREQM